MYEFMYFHHQTIIETANFSFQFKKNVSNGFCYIEATDSAEFDIDGLSFR